MSIMPVIGVIGGVLDKIIPDANLRAQAKADLAVLEVSGELQQILGQLEINKEEAKHESRFVSGWRPAIGWICGFAFGYHYLLYPFIQTTVAVSGGDISGFPVFDLSQMLPVLLGMLGLGGLRSFEKFTKSNNNR